MTNLHCHEKYIEMNMTELGSDDADCYTKLTVVI